MERKLLIKCGDYLDERHQPFGVRYIAVTELSGRRPDTSFFHPSILGKTFDGIDNHSHDVAVDCLLGIMFISLGLQNKEKALQKIIEAGNKGIEVKVPQGFKVFSSKLTQVA